MIAGVSLEAFDVGNPNSAHVSCSLLELIVTHSFLFLHTLFIRNGHSIAAGLLKQTIAPRRRVGISKESVVSCSIFQVIYFYGLKKIVNRGFVIRFCCWFTPFCTGEIKKRGHSWKNKLQVT